MYSVMDLINNLDQIKDCSWGLLAGLVPWPATIWWVWSDVIWSVICCDLVCLLLPNFGVFCYLLWSVVVASLLWLLFCCLGQHLLQLWLCYTGGWVLDTKDSYEPVVQICWLCICLVLFLCICWSLTNRYSVWRCNVSVYLLVRFGPSAVMKLQRSNTSTLEPLSFVLVIAVREYSAASYLAMEKLFDVPVARHVVCQIECDWWRGWVYWWNKIEI